MIRQYIRNTVYSIFLRFRYLLDSGASEGGHVDDEKHFPPVNPQRNRFPFQ